MSPAGPDLIALATQVLGTFLFFLVFLFLWRQSGIVSFGLWSLAWLLETVALAFAWLYVSSGQTAWLAPYAFLEYSYALALAGAARQENIAAPRSRKATLRILAGFPLVLALAYGLGLQSRFAGFRAWHTLVLAGLYLFGASRLRRGARGGAQWFRVSLIALAAGALAQAAGFYGIYREDSATAWPLYLRYYNLGDLALQTLLALSAMAMWIENQRHRILALDAELDTVRRDVRKDLELDRLTGLGNQTALERRLESADSFSGVVAVCDMDNFKSINDRYGHLVGDEILRNIGRLLRSSIRHEDEAFRWGGDEFVILFHNQNRAVVTSRMAELRQHLSAFQVRGFGALPISFSWGTAELQGGPLRKAVDEADREMYANKPRQPAERPMGDPQS